MTDVMLRARVQEAIASVASLEALQLICRESNCDFTAEALTMRLHRDLKEVREALERFVRAGLLVREDLPNGQRLYGLSPSPRVWRFAEDFVRRFGEDREYLESFIVALVLNTQRRTDNRAAAAA